MYVTSCTEYTKFSSHRCFTDIVVTSATRDQQLRCPRNKSIGNVTSSCNDPPRKTVPAETRKSGRKLLIVWNGLRSHRRRIVWDFVRQQRGRIWLEFLSVSALELNPVGTCWAHQKHHELPNFCPDSYAELSHARRPMPLCAFWQQAQLFPL